MGDGDPEEERAGTPYGEAEHMDGLRQAGFTIAPGGLGVFGEKGLAPSIEHVKPRFLYCARFHREQITTLSMYG